MEREEYTKPEYTRENYPSFGKPYMGEKAIISLTSWRARINTVSKTLFSLLKQCPGFHIVLVLSEEEFPQKEKELPENLMVFVENELIELLWVYKNYKSFKKVLFTMDKYRDVPVISADDDCIYTCNYAQELYDEWMKNKNCVITNDGGLRNNFQWCRGPNTLYPPKLKLNPFRICDTYFSKGFSFIEDDMLIGFLIRLSKITIKDLKKKPFYIFHDETMPQTMYKPQNFTMKFNSLKLLAFEIGPD